MSAEKAPNLGCFCLIFDAPDSFMLLQPEALEFG
jgi:hypothetical protein